MPDTQDLILLSLLISLGGQGYQEYQGYHVSGTSGLDTLTQPAITENGTERRPETSNLNPSLSSQERAVLTGCDIQFGAGVHMGRIQAGRPDLSCFLSSQGFIENRNHSIINEL